MRYSVPLGPVAYQKVSLFPMTILKHTANPTILSNIYFCFCSFSSSTIVITHCKSRAIQKTPRTKMITSSHSGALSGPHSVLFVFARTALTHSTVHKVSTEQQLRVDPEQGNVQERITNIPSSAPKHPRCRTSLNGKTALLLLIWNVAHRISCVVS